MESITSVTELKKAIQILEVELEVKEQILKEQFLVTFESLKPVNMLKSTLKEVVTSPHLIENIAGSVLGLVTGYFSQKLIVGASSNLLKKVLGTALQFGVTNLVAQHTGSKSSIGQFFSKLFSRKKTAHLPE
jgi:hypothetical protein